MAVAYQNTLIQLLLKACLHKQLPIKIKLFCITWHVLLFSRNEELLVIENSKEVGIHQSKLCIDTKNFSEDTR